LSVDNIKLHILWMLMNKSRNWPIVLWLCLLRS